MPTSSFMYFTAQNSKIDFSGMHYLPLFISGLLSKVYYLRFEETLPGQIPDELADFDVRNSTQRCALNHLRP